MVERCTASYFATKTSGKDHLAVCVCALMLFVGCRTPTEMYVWHPPAFPELDLYRVALAPIIAQKDLAPRIEDAILSQRPAVRSDIQLVTAEQLDNLPLVRLASSASIPGDRETINAARAMDVQLLIFGQVLQENLDTLEQSRNQRNSYASSSGTAIGSSVSKRIAVFWRLIDVTTGSVVGSHTLAIDQSQADAQYPDLMMIAPDPSSRVILASARETWKSVAPYVVRDKVDLALPWLMPGSAQVRRGNRLARQGRWDLAEEQWHAASSYHPWNSAAQLNYSIALVAKEDFSAALERLGKVGPIGRKREQAETLIWLDQRHRWYRAAHRLPPPDNGWAFPDPQAAAAEVELATDVPGPDELPWWTILPGAKPPGWTWQAWLSQPWLY